MKSFNDLLDLNDPHESLTPLERSLAFYLSDEDFDAESITDDEVEKGLLLYYNSKTVNFWKKVINLKNFKLFYSISDAKEMAKEWISEREELKIVKGTLNLKTLLFKSSESIINELLLFLSPSVEENEISRTIKQLEFLDESLDQEIPVTLIRINNNHYEMVLNSKKEDPSWVKKNVRSVSMAVLCGVLFSQGAFAQDRFAPEQDDTRDAVSAFGKAVMAHDQVKTKVRTISKDMEKKAKKVLDENGLEVPAAVVGAGIKGVIEGKFEIKGKTKLVPAKYNLELGVNNISFKVSNDEILGSNSECWIETEAMASETRVGLGVKFGF